MEQNKTQEKPLCEKSLDYGSYTNTGMHGLYYSLRNKKFIKGYIDGTRLGGFIRYRLYPGRYIEFLYFRKSSEDPPRSVFIHLVEIDESCKKHYLRSAAVKFYKREELDALGLPKQILDFIGNVPCYHCKPSPSIFEIIYDESEHMKLLEFVTSAKHVTVGEEHE